MFLSSSSRLKPSLLLACAALVLSSCAYFEKAEPTGEEIDLMAGDGAPVEQVTQPAPSRIDLMDMANSANGRDVRVFSLDQAAPSGSVNAPISGGVGRPSLSNPSVEIFPLDDAMAVPAMNRPSAPAVPVTPVDVELQHESAVQGEKMTVPGMDGITRVFFPHGKSTLTAQDEAIVSRVASMANGAVKVDGHASAQADIADPIKRKVANLKTSMNRAFEVAKSLIMNGVPAENIQTAAYGDTRPAAATPYLDAESASRRVEITTQ